MKNNNGIVKKVIEKYSQKEEVSEFSRLVEIGLYNFEERFIDLNIKPPKNILNLGCGGGREAIALANKGFEILAFDYSINMCFEAKKNIEREEKKIKVIQMNAIDLGILNDKFDCCIMFGQLIAYIPKREIRINLLKECKRVLKPGGIIIFSTHSRKYKLKYKLYFNLINPLRIFLKSLGFRNILEVNDRFTKQVSAVKSSGKCFLHHYSMDEAIEDINLAGLKFIMCRGSSELIRNITNENIREKGYLLFFSAKKE